MYSTVDLLPAPTSISRYDPGVSESIEAVIVAGPGRPGAELR